MTTDEIVGRGHVGHAQALGDLSEADEVIDVDPSAHQGEATPCGLTNALFSGLMEVTPRETRWPRRSANCPGPWPEPCGGPDDE